MHEVPKLYNLSGVWRSPFNQYDSIVLPVETWLKERGVRFEYGVQVTNLEFEVTEKER
jgi:oleate hydratase